MNLTKAWSELKRILPLLAVILIAFLFFKSATQIAMQLYQISMTAVAILVLHYIRKKLFPYVDMGELVFMAKRDAVASAIVFASVMIFLAIALYASRV